MKKESNRYAMLVILALILSNCSPRIMDYTIISSKNVSVEYQERSEKRTTGVHSGFQFLGIPFTEPNMKEAVDRAIESAPEGQMYDALIDGVISRRYRWFVLFGLNQYVVEGTPISTHTMKNKEEPKPTN